jgi:hypothetical protein
MIAITIFMCWASRLRRPVVSPGDLVAPLAPAGPQLRRNMQFKGRANVLQERQSRIQRRNHAGEAGRTVESA